MIFYFTATGNSKFAAEKIAEATQERVIDIGGACRRGEFEYAISSGERLGFVLPVFAGTLPGIVGGVFLERLVLDGYLGQYAYGVFTCGENSGYESAALNYALSLKSISLNASFDLVMPDNFIIWSDIPPKQKLDSLLVAADHALEKIIMAVKSNTNSSIDSSIPEMPYFPNQEISTSKGTSKLLARDACTACGLCSKICPMGIIKPQADGRPAWEGSCSMCLACLHRCPSEAIEHGADTVGKRRYINPNVEL